MAPRAMRARSWRRSRTTSPSRLARGLCHGDPRFARVRGEAAPSVP
jgi:hypothetical protein